MILSLEKRNDKRQVVISTQIDNEEQSIHYIIASIESSFGEKMKQLVLRRAILALRPLSAFTECGV
jgi:hypothetical protein